MKIEQLNTENLEEMLTTGEICHGESMWIDYKFDRNIFKRKLEQMIGNENCFAYVGLNYGKVIGFFLAGLGFCLFSDKPIGKECGVYVLPEYRGTSIAFDMFDEFKKWCLNKNVIPFVEVYFKNDNERSYNFFKKQGMIECGKIFKGIT